EAINAGGLCRELGAVEETRYPQATSDPSAIGSCDAVLVLVKAHQTAWAAEQARALLKPDSQQFDKVTRPALSPSAPRLLSPSKGRVNSAEGWQGGNVQHDQGTTLSPPQPVTLSQTPVVTLQNGIGNRELLAEALGGGRVGQGVTSL